MIVPSRWVRKWLLFAHVKAGEPPGPIDMWPLLKQDNTAPGGWRPINTLEPPSTQFGSERPGHYRYAQVDKLAKLSTALIGAFYCDQARDVRDVVRAGGPVRGGGLRHRRCKQLIERCRTVALSQPLPPLLLLLSQRGIPFDDLTRWRVFKDPKYIDVVSAPLQCICHDQLCKYSPDRTTHVLRSSIVPAEGAPGAGAARGEEAGGRGRGGGREGAGGRRLRSALRQVALSWLARAGSRSPVVWHVVSLARRASTGEDRRAWRHTPRAGLYILYHAFKVIGESTDACRVIVQRVRGSCEATGSEDFIRPTENDRSLDEHIK
jgi:hypothetical protein